MRLLNSRTVPRRCFILLWFILLPFLGIPLGEAQHDESRIYVNVVLVQLNIAVTDSKGNYVTGLRPEDFSITEDHIAEKVATFEEGNEPTRRLINIGASSVAPTQQSQPNARVAGEPMNTGDPANTSGIAPVGANVFIL